MDLRIEALGLVLLISLLIWRLIEHAMCMDLEARNTMLPGWDNKPTRRPSAYMMTWKFKGVIVLCVGPQRHLAKTPLARSEGFPDGFAGPRALFYSSASCWLKRVSKNSKFSCQLGAECTIKRKCIA
jgi:hypothetical protein